MRRAAVLAAGLALCGAAPAGITVEGGWMRAITPQVPAGGYFTVHNAGTAAQTLTGASSPACGMLMLHKSSDTGGMETMRAVPSLPVPPGGTVRFAPGGYHLMCMEPGPAIKPGSTVPVTLEFAGGGSVTTSFAVRGANGK